MAAAGYDPYCPLPRPHGHHWNGLGGRAADERECHGEPARARQPNPENEPKEETRGTCAGCGRPYQLNTDRTLRAHPRRRTDGSTDPRQNCAGSNQKPKEET